MSRNTGRASGASQAFSRLSTSKTPVEPSSAPKPKKPSSVPAAEKTTSKYTLLLEPADALLWDELAMTLRRDLGRKIDKSSMVRALVYLAAEDEDLRRELTDVLRREGVTA